MDKESLEITRLALKNFRDLQQLNATGLWISEEARKQSRELVIAANKALRDLDV